MSPAPWLAALTLFACNERGGADFERMLDQHKSRAYQGSPFFEDGRSMRPPPLFAVSREADREPPEVRSGSSAGAYLDRIPVPIDRALVERGERRFLVFCAPCHGVLGDGVSKVAENMARRPAPSLHAAPIDRFVPGRLYRVIRDGYGLMPSYADALDVRDRWAVVSYVEALKVSQRLPVASLTPELEREARPWLSK